MLDTIRAERSLVEEVRVLRTRLSRTERERAELAGRVEALERRSGDVREQLRRFAGAGSVQAEPPGNQGISPRRQAERALRAVEQRCRTLLEHMPIAAFTFDQQGRILSWNRAAEQTYGYTAAEATGASLYDLTVTPETKEATDEVIRRVFAGETMTGMEWQDRDKHGKTGWRKGNTFPLFGADGTVDCGVNMNVDLTRHREAEHDRRELQQELHQAQKMEAVGQLAGGVAHDFNNLLTVIMGHAGLAQQAVPETSPAYDSLKLIQRAAKQATGVTRSLLMFSRRIPTRKQRIDLHRVLDESCRMLRRALPASIEFVAAPAPAEPVWVNADATQIQQVIMNLAINARDAMPDGGTLSVSLSVCPRAGAAALARQVAGKGPLARLQIRDTGCGIPPSIRSRIFEPFFTTKARGQGTGLGLAVIHGIVESHGGAIQVETQPGRGSTFRVYLGCVETGDALADAPVAAPEPGQGELLLVAEDNELVAGAMMSLFESLGYKVVHVADGIALTEQTSTLSDRLALLIVDIDLPRRDGLTALAQLRAAGHQVPAIIVTGKPPSDLEMGLDEHTVLLHKPFELVALANLAARLLARAPVATAC